MCLCVEKERESSNLIEVEGLRHAHPGALNLNVWGLCHLFFIILMDYVLQIMISTNCKIEYAWDILFVELL